MYLAVVTDRDHSGPSVALTIKSENQCFLKGERKNGSPQESDEVGILGGFLESEEFGLGSGQSLCLEQEIVHVTVATTSAKDRLDISVDRFHHAERNLIRTIVQDSIEVLD